MSFLAMRGEVDGGAKVFPRPRQSLPTVGPNMPVYTEQKTSTNKKKYRQRLVSGLQALHRDLPKTWATLSEAARRYGAIPLTACMATVSQLRIWLCGQQPPAVVPWHSAKTSLLRLQEIMHRGSLCSKKKHKKRDPLQQQSLVGQHEYFQKIRKRMGRLYLFLYVL